MLSHRDGIRRSEVSRGIYRDIYDRELTTTARKAFAMGFALGAFVALSCVVFIAIMQQGNE